MKIIDSEEYNNADANNDSSTSVHISDLTIDEKNNSIAGVFPSFDCAASKTVIVKMDKDIQITANFTAHGWYMFTF